MSHQLFCIGLYSAEVTGRESCLNVCEALECNSPGVSLANLGNPEGARLLNIDDVNAGLDVAFDDLVDFAT